MTTILATSNKLYADKRCTYFLDNPPDKFYSDKATKIIVPANNLSCKEMIDDKDPIVHKIAAIAFSGNVDLNNMIVKELTKEDCELRDFIQSYVNFNYAKDTENVAGVFVTNEGKYGMFYFNDRSGNLGFCDEAIQKFALKGSGVSFDIHNNWTSFDGDIDSFFIAVTYMDSGSVPYYDVYDHTTKAVETIHPTDEVVEAAVLKNFNPHFYTGPKKVFK